jgi:hypothetical protein
MCHNMVVYYIPLPHRVVGRYRHQPAEGPLLGLMRLLRNPIFVLDAVRIASGERDDGTGYYRRDNMEPSYSWAIQHARLLLVRHGLTEAQADAFLQELRAEFLRGALNDQQARDAFYRHHAEKLAALTPNKGQGNRLRSRVSLRSPARPASVLTGGVRGETH